MKYEHTHVSTGDGSPAMLVETDGEKITLVNEDGHQWTDPASDWRPIGSPEANPHDNDRLTAELKEVMRDTEVRLQFTFAFGTKGTMHGVLIEHRSGYTGRWSKYPYVIFPSEGETVADVMHMLATGRAEALS